MTNSMTPTNLRALVERLRGYRGGDIEYRKLMDDAADRIEELEAEREAMLAALCRADASLGDAFDGCATLGKIAEARRQIEAIFVNRAKAEGK